MTYQKQTQQTRARHATQRTTNREQVRSLANAVAGLRTWHALKPNTTPSDTKQHDKNSYATDQCVIGADEQKQQSWITSSPLMKAEQLMKDMCPHVNPATPDAEPNT